MQVKHVGFLKLCETESKDSYIGAILITNLSSVPVEFRVTLPVKPTAVQRSLYGNALVPYIGVELCGKPLLQAITHKMELIFVTPACMLDVRPHSTSPVVHVQKTGEVIEMTPSGKDTIASVNQNRLELPGGQFQPITLVSAPDFADDLIAVQPVVEELSSKFDLLEPFDRIDRAVVVLAQQDARFSK